MKTQTNNIMEILKEKDSERYSLKIRRFIYLGLLISSVIIWAILLNWMF